MYKNRIALFICATLYATNTFSEEKITDNQSNMLPEIVVYGEHNKSLSSTQTLTSAEMEKTPTSNNNITDYLRSNPHIRYEDSDQDGFQRGEIKPQNISINGADANQTAYFVDNVNVNNDLTVDSEIFDGAMQVLPGISHTQAYFFDASMLSKVEVHDSNISASLGGFMGGAVVAKTKQYNGKDSVSLKYRTTNSGWAKMNVDNSAQNLLDKIRPDAAGVAEFQPKYRKQTFNIVLEKGLTDNLGMVLGYSKRHSRIQQNRLIGYDTEAKLNKQNHLRNSDNLLLNFNLAASEKDRFELGFRYSNYKEQKYYTTNIDSDVSDYHQAFGTTLAWVHSFDSGVWTNTLAYDRFNDRRKSSSANVETVSVFDENDEQFYDYEKGGYGNSSLTQDNLHFSTEFAVDPFDLGTSRHSISVGGIYQATHYKFHRPQDVRQKLIVQSPFYPSESTSITYSGRAKTRYQNFVFYAEDLISWKKLEFRPGVRIERDDYLQNNNIAPRFVARYKPWEETGLTLGLNRYYGRSFASLKLTNEILKINRDTSREYQAFNSLKTPYADEVSLGIEQEFGNLAFKLNYIHRQNKNRILLKRDANRVNSYHNGSDFSVDIYTFQVNNIEPWKWGNTYWTGSLGFDWLNTKRADIGRELDPNETVYLDGKLMTRRNMLNKANSSTEDWIARLGVDMTIPDYHITWSNKVYMKAPIRSYELLDSNFDDDISRYRSYHYGRHTQWDSSIRWQPTITGNHSVYLQVDILNVLNQTRKSKTVRAISTNDEYGIYTPGREFWLEVGYKF
ncbi:TonB-dependent receptor [Rodentibacter genomosp. 1]|uniref:TonB-dependent receptor n=1 Tax=Rodentibacter genomosp. 1 TaxID=1908264 RepID=A0A1V3J3G7_9PAST|nr:TonB-dependent receptor plug domain-containing protein [Rodentibacter genomosp. 1]OOF49672.1 TonB-dependent receptor [Rodentibacter genomosp. 1]